MTTSHAATVPKHARLAAFLPLLSFAQGPRQFAIKTVAAQLCRDQLAARSETQVVRVPLCLSTGHTGGWMYDNDADDIVVMKM